jgi:hypothetical protein
MLTHLMDNGLDLYEVSRYGRHRSIASTKIYLHLADLNLAHQVNQIHERQWLRLEMLFQERQKRDGGSRCPQLKPLLFSAKRRVKSCICPFRRQTILTAILSSQKRNETVWCACDADFYMLYNHPGRDGIF